MGWAMVARTAMFMGDCLAWCLPQAHLSALSFITCTPHRSTSCTPLKFMHPSQIKFMHPSQFNFIVGRSTQHRLALCVCVGGGGVGRVVAKHFLSSGNKLQPLAGLAHPLCIPMVGCVDAVHGLGSAIWTKGMLHIAPPPPKLTSICGLHQALYHRSAIPLRNDSQESRRSPFSIDNPTSVLTQITSPYCTTCFQCPCLHHTK